MKIIDYKVQALKFILPYFRTNKDIVAILNAIASRFNLLQNVVKDLRESLYIKNARGVWLDYIGDEVGAQRDEADFGNYFCVNRDHINVEKQFYFLSSGLDPKSPLTLSDAEFIQKIYAYIGANSSSGSIEEILEIIKTITNANDIKVTISADFVLKINLIGDGLIMTRNTINYIQQILGDGIYLEEIQINGKTN